jgi:hypothetical protein
MPPTSERIACRPPGNTSHAAHLKAHATRSEEMSTGDAGRDRKFALSLAVGRYSHELHLGAETTADPAHPDMALPTFFIIGAAKSGTTSLHYYLDQHVEIQMSANKEPNFFAGPENGIPYPARRISRLDEYERLFDPAVGVRGEASPGYTNYPRRQGVPERIKDLVPQAKFIYLVRDPIARTVSHYQHLVSIGEEHRSLQDALSDLANPYLPLICHSRYASQLELYLSHFPQERMLVIDQADLLADRRSTLRKIFAFLSVDDTFASTQFDQELFKSSERRALPSGYGRFVERVVAPTVQWVPKRTRRSLRRSVERMLWPPLQTPTLDENLRASLRELYAGEVERLRALTGQGFPTWSM